MRAASWTRSTTFEVLDTANLAAGWTLLAPMPTPGGEGRAYGFDSDTLKVNSPYQGKIVRGGSQ